MSKFHMPIWTLLVLVLLFGVGLGALKNPTEAVANTVFTLMVILLCVATIVALTRNGRGRVLWLTPTVFGWAYLTFTFGRTATPPPQLLISAWVADGLNLMDKMAISNMGKSNGTTTPYRAEFVAFHQIGQTLATLAVGLLAALIVSLVVKPDPNKRYDTHEPQPPQTPL